VRCVRGVNSAGSTPQWTMCTRSQRSGGVQISTWLRQKWLMQVTKSARENLASSRHHVGAKKMSGPCSEMLNVKPPRAAASMATVPLELAK
jgi:hypothetical protein